MTNVPTGVLLVILLLLLLFASYCLAALKLKWSRRDWVFNVIMGATILLQIGMAAYLWLIVLGVEP